MKKIRLFICAVTGHRSVVVSTFLHKIAARSMITTRIECERCGKKQVFTVDPKD